MLETRLCFRLISYWKRLYMEIAPPVEHPQVREARELRELAALAMGRGDYKKAVELDLRVVELAPDSDVGREAKKEARLLGLDRYAVYAGAFTTALYLFGWIAALR